jgi:hypothetical protein
MLALTIDEVAEMLGSWHDAAIADMRNERERREAVEAYVEHMRAGGFEVGHDYPRSGRGGPPSRS